MNSINFNVKNNYFTDSFIKKLDAMMSEPWQFLNYLRELHSVYGSACKMSASVIPFDLHGKIKRNNVTVKKQQKRGYFAYVFEG